jgi:CRP-like cAMP-binding protein
MYVILSGSIHLTKTGKVLQTLAAGNAFGFVSFLDGEPRGVGAHSADECELALIDQRKFRYMVEEVPNFVWYVLDQMAHHLRVTSAVI